MKGRFIIDGNAFYEIDEECFKNLQAGKKTSDCLSKINLKDSDMPWIYKKEYPNMN